MDTFIDFSDNYTVLDLLAGNTARSATLRLFWEEGFAGNVRSAAQRLDFSYSVVHGEVKALERAGLVKSTRSGAATVVRANAEYEHAALLRQVIAAKPTRASADNSKLYSELAATGAPLVAPHRKPRGSLEDLFARAAVASRQDGTLLRALPAWLGMNAEALDQGALVDAVAHSDEPHAGGFVLALAARVTGLRRFATASKVLRDERRRRAEPFLKNLSAGPAWRKRAERVSPDVAKQWHYLLNMPLDAFRDTWEQAKA